MDQSIQYTPLKEDEVLEQGQGPLMSGTVVHNGLVYLSGKGARGVKDIREAAKQVLDRIEADLAEAGSSIHRVLKVTVFLDDLNDFSAMNEMYRGRFGENPPVRSTVATYAGIPGDSIIEIDCIAALNE
ncbi:MAG: RidA family protein [Balneolaceae bacterium]